MKQHRIRVKSLVASAFFALLFPALACSSDFMVQPFSEARGLSNKDVNAIYQDSQGFLWLATADGLDRYDGKAFLVFNFQVDANPKASFQDSKFTCCVQDAGGMLWVGTRRGLHRFDPMTFKIDSFRDEAFAPSLIEGIQANRDELWVLAKGKVYRKQGQHFDVLPSSTTLGIHAILADQGGRLWAGGDEGLYSMTANGLERASLSINERIIALREDGGRVLAVTQGGRAYSVSDGRASLLFSLPCAINDILALSGGTYLAASVQGLYEYDQASDEVRRIDSVVSKPLRALLRDRSGAIWLGGWDTGLVLLREKDIGVASVPVGRGADYDRLRKSVSAADDGDILWLAAGGSSLYGLSASSGALREYLLGQGDSLPRITALEKGVAHELWVGTDKGLYRFDATVHSFARVSSQAVRALRAQGGRLWIGGEEGVSLYNPSTQGVKNYSLPYAPVEEIYEDHKGRVWVSMGEEGFYRFISEREGFRYYDYFDADDKRLKNMAFGSFFETKDGRLWFRVDSGLFAYDEAKDALTPVDIPGADEAVWDVAEGRDGRLLVAAEAGAFTYDSKTRSLSPVPGEAQSRALTLFQDSRGTYWIGSYGGGLVARDAKGERRFGVKEGLPSGIVYSIGEDGQGRLWVLTQKGVALIDLTSEHVMPLSLGPSARSSYFAQWGFFETSSDLFCFIGREDVAVVNPRLIESGEKNLPFLVTQVSLGGKLLPPNAWSSGLRVKWDERFMDISFAVLDLAAPEDIAYEYSLSPNKGEWISLGNSNRVSLAGAASGRYLLSVRASSSRSNLAEASRSLVLPVVVAPPFWRSAFAYALYLLLVAAAAAAAWWLYRQRREAKERTWKLDLVSDISHNLFTPLSLITNSTRDLVDSLARDSEGYRRGKVISDNCKTLEDDLRQMLSYIKERIEPEAAARSYVSLATTLSGYIEQYKSPAVAAHIELSVDTAKAEGLYALLDQRGLEKTLQNIVENAFAYAKGRIVAKAYRNLDRICIEIEDDGEPIPEELVDRIFERGFKGPQSKGSGLGLAYVERYAKANGGSVVVKNHEAGKSFVLCFPLVEIEAIRPMVGARPRLLLVEDDLKLSQYLAAELGPEYSVVTAQNYKEALSRLKAEEPPDLILMDRKLPGGEDGINILIELKNTYELQSLPLVFLSAIADSEEKIRALDLGAADYIAKPFVMEELRMRLRAILKRDQVVIDAFKEQVMRLGAKTRSGYASRHIPVYERRVALYDAFDLTKSERGIVESILLDDTIQNKEIAMEFTISEQTVKNHLGNIYRKLGINRRDDIRKRMFSMDSAKAEEGHGESR